MSDPINHHHQQQQRFHFHSFQSLHFSPILLGCRQQQRSLFTLRAYSFPSHFSLLFPFAFPCQLAPRSVHACNDPPAPAAAGVDLQGLTVSSSSSSSRQQQGLLFLFCCGCASFLRLADWLQNSLGDRQASRLQLLMMGLLTLAVSGCCCCWRRRQPQTKRRPTSAPTSAQQHTKSKQLFPFIHTR